MLRRWDCSLVHPSSARIDPAADAAQLLRRIGFAVLCVALPMAAITARRGAVILMPVGAILLILAALLEPTGKSLGERLRELLAQPLMWMVAGLGAWAVLSLFWTPGPRGALDRIANLAGLLALATGVLAALPPRLRAPILYMMPIGAFAAAAVATIVLIDARSGRSLFNIAADAVTVQRGLATLVLLGVPAAGWLLSRGRLLDALLLGVALMGVAVTAQDFVMAACVALGAMAFGATRLRPLLASMFVAVALALIAAVALLPLFIKGWQGQTIAGLQLMPLLTGSFLRRLGRLVTGYGIEATPRMIAGNYFQPNGPTYFAGMWFDLGLVAIALIGAGFVAALRQARMLSTDVAAATTALIAVIAIQGAFLPGTYQAWWLSSVIAAVIGVAAIARGQGRTRRPGIGLFARPPAGKRA